MFKIGDKLEAEEHHKEEFNLDYVTITSINKKTKVYHWEAPLCFGKLCSGYFFKNAKLYKDETNKN